MLKLGFHIIQQPFFNNALCIISQFIVHKGKFLLKAKFFKAWTEIVFFYIVFKSINCAILTRKYTIPAPLVPLMHPQIYFFGGFPKIMLVHRIYVGKNNMPINIGFDEGMFSRY